MSKITFESSPFDDPPKKSLGGAPVPNSPGPEQFSISTIALITFDIAFILGWWANASSHTYFGELPNEYAQRVIGSTLRIGIVGYPFWAAVIAFLPALAGASLGTCAHHNVDHRRRIRGASLFWTLASGILLETIARLVLLALDPGSDAKMLWWAFGNLGWGGLTLVAYLAWMAMIAAGYGLVISLTLALLGRWKMIPLPSPWSDAPWKAMWKVGLYGPYLWLLGFLIWALAGKPELLTL
jgi:hypothetical protein